VDLTDEELCRRIAAGDSTAFEQLVERYQTKAFRMATSILTNEADGRDVSQEAFLRLYESAHRFDGRARFSTWFYRILVNLCIDHQRRNRWWKKVIPLTPPGDSDEPPLDPPSDTPGPESLVIGAQNAARLREALKQLSPSQRAAVMMQIQDDLSSREIASVLKCSETTARVHLHRGVTRLAKAMKDG
jgi:RNA polymerase sigma-70 factor (ECF subfamily)